MTTPGGLGKRWIEATVFAPIGIVAALRTDLPAHIERGRVEAANRIRFARFIGEMAVKVVTQQAAQAAAERSAEQLAAAEPVASSAPEAGDQPFAGYDALVAAEVVERLRSLPAAELQAVRAYELAHRGRRTVLGKIEQLLARR